MLNGVIVKALAPMAPATLPDAVEQDEPANSGYAVELGRVPAGIDSGALGQCRTAVPGGVSLCWLSSRLRRAVGFGVPVVGAGAEHGEKDVAAASCQADQGGVVFLALVSFPLVVGPAGGIGQGRERGEEERPFELAVARSGGMLALDAGAGAAGDRGDPGVGGQVSGGLERGGVADSLPRLGRQNPRPVAGQGQRAGELASTPTSRRVSTVRYTNAAPSHSE
jgi:hypothetical protein